jgi:hypothetical protein
MYIRVKANTEAELIEAFPMFHSENEWLTNYGKSDFLYIGKMYTGGTYDEQGEVITPPVALEGVHANMVNRDNIEIPKGMVVTPKDAKIKWLGE